MALPAPAPTSTCLVTGASSGIGADLARALAKRGHGVTLVARREIRLKELAAELEDRHGVRADVVPADLSDATSRQELVDAVAGLGRTVEVLVNNAGLGTSGVFADNPREDHLHLVRLDIEAVVDLAAVYVPAMVGRGRGAVLNVASTAAFQPLPGMATYAAAKAFVLSFSESLAAEAGAHGVTVTALCPGPVKTEFGQRAGLGDAETKVPSFVWTTSQQVAEAAVRGMASGRRVVIPGPLNQVSAIAGRFSPRSVLLTVVRKFNPAVRG